MNEEKENKRVIYTKHVNYILDESDKGVLIEEYWRDIDIPQSVKGALVYETARGPLIARQDTLKKED